MKEALLLGMKYQLILLKLAKKETLHNIDDKVIEVLEEDRTEADEITGSEEEMDVTKARTNEADENETGSKISALNVAGTSNLTVQITSDDRVVEIHETNTHNPVFVLVMDNIDMNARRSDQRDDRTTSSYHFCHAFALLNRVNSTLLA